MKHFFRIILLCILISSCGSKKEITKKSTKQNKTVDVSKKEDKTLDTNTPVNKKTRSKNKYSRSKLNEDILDYINTYKDIAIIEMRKYNIPASITLAQGILESGSGKGRLSKEANNHFGIKCHNWEGKKIYHDDDTKQECFRKYKSANYSFRDHSEFLINRKRYARLFDLDKGDYTAWAKELRKAGYATDKKYPNKLIKLIETYQLYKLDEQVLGKRSQKSNTYTVVHGDTLYSISKKYNLTVKELQDINNLEGTLLYVGQVLYLNPLQKKIE